MKKTGVLIILSILLISLVLAQTTTPGLDSALPGGITTENLEKARDTFTDLDQTNWEYLQQEWTKAIMGNKILGGFIKFINPLIKAFTGYEFSMTIIFLVALIISVAIYSVYFEGIKLFYDSTLMALAISILMTIITSSAGLTRKLAPEIAEFLSNTWYLVGFIILGIILIFFIYCIGKIVKKWKEKKAAKEAVKAKRELRGTIHAMKSVKKGANEASMESSSSGDISHLFGSYDT